MQTRRSSLACEGHKGQGYRPPLELESIAAVGGAIDAEVGGPLCSTAHVSRSAGDQLQWTMWAGALAMILQAHRLMIEAIWMAKHVETLMMKDVQCNFNCKTHHIRGLCSPQRQR